MRFDSRVRQKMTLGTNIKQNLVLRQFFFKENFQKADNCRHLIKNQSSNVKKNMKIEVKIFKNQVNYKTTNSFDSLPKQKNKISNIAHNL